METGPAPNDNDLNLITDESELEYDKKGHEHLYENENGHNHSVLHKVGRIEEAPPATVYQNALPESFTVPPGSLFMMGDHRDNSFDSRYWGFAPEENVLGKAMFVWLSCEKSLPIINVGCTPLSIRWGRFLHAVD